MKFTLKANMLFSANDIDDALLKLSAHFQNIAEYSGGGKENGMDRSDLIEKGYCSVELPEQDKRIIEIAEIFKPEDIENGD